MVIEVRQTPLFAAWLAGLRDERAQQRIAQRLVRLASGLVGDVKVIGGGVSELRIDHGPGYRLYFCGSPTRLVLLLCGGDKSSQRRDIERAKAMAVEWER